MNVFNVYPAIDLRRGEVVRLRQGDPQRQTTYGHDPEGVARDWQDAGASWLHVVNLDGAFGDDESDKNLTALQAIVNTGAQVQFGGGIRSRATLDVILEMGVERAILGTVAVEEPQLVRHAVADYGPSRVVVGIDARQGKVSVRGWLRDTSVDPLSLAKNLKQMGVSTTIVTDISRDGMDEGVNLELAQQLAQTAELSVIAAGGVNSLEDVRRARQAGLHGIIIGRALYEGQVSLKEALQC